MNRHIFLLIIIISSLKCSNESASNSGSIRIISLSPSVTSQIIDLEAEDNLVGVTPYCPLNKEGVAIVGTYINPSIETIISLKPDIVLMSEEDRDIQRDNFFKKFGLNYYKFARNENFETICNNYKKLSDMIGKRDFAEKKIESYVNRLNKIKTGDVKLKTVFLVSVKPLITISDQSYISDIIKHAGGINIFKDLKNPYPILTIEALIIKQPHVVIVMNHGDDLFLRNRLKNFHNIEFVNKKNIFAIGDENIPYYTPKDYVISVEKIYEILNHVK
ncbi:MAG: helical backbone metal receptor [Leptospirales bacterium]|nr:helical backbone metal receptor [Leptospirales bacterium]